MSDRRHLTIEYNHCFVPQNIVPVYSWEAPTAYYEIWQQRLSEAAERGGVIVGPCYPEIHEIIQEAQGGPRSDS
jgi:hypothetical protein